MPPKERVDAQNLYANILEEFKLRMEVINHSVSGKSGLAPPFVKELCYLQIRMMCELVAMGCLVAHGDIKESRLSKLQKEWSAERIMNELELLHPHFYPQPVKQIITPTEIRVEAIESPLPKAAFLSLYGRCGDALHRGSVKKLLKGQFPRQINYPEIVAAVQPLVDLVNHHLIAMRSGDEIFLAMLNNVDDQGRVQVAIANRPAGVPVQSEELSHET